MNKLLELARVSYELEKAAEDSTARKVGRVAAGAAGLVVGMKAGRMVGGVTNGMRAASNVAAKYPGAMHRAVQEVTREAAQKGGRIGARVGAVSGVGAGVAAVGQEKKASLVDIAKTLASTTKGVGVVAKNVVKQNPAAAKAAAGGLVAGAVLAPRGQTKQAEQKKPYGVLRSARDAVLTVADSYAGKAVGGLIGAKLHKIPKRINGTLAEGTADVMHHMRGVGFGQGVGATAGAYMGLKDAQGRREEHQKYAAVADKALAKEEKANADPSKFKDPAKGSGKGLGKSSLIDVARKEMAKSASKK